MPAWLGSASSLGLASPIRAMTGSPRSAENTFPPCRDSLQRNSEPVLGLSSLTGKSTVRPIGAKSHTIALWLLVRSCSDLGQTDRQFGNWHYANFTGMRPVSRRQRLRLTSVEGSQRRG